MLALLSFVLVAALFPSSLAAAAPGASVQIRVNSPSGVASCIVADGDFDGATVSIVPCANALLSASSWTIEHGVPASGTGPATNIRIHANKCLDAVNGVNADGTKLQIWTCGNNSPNQTFNVNANGHLVWWGKNKCVDVTNGQFGGVQMQVWTCASANPNQLFTTPTVEPANGHIRLPPLRAHSQPYCLTASGNTNGAPVILELCTGGNEAVQGWSGPRSGFGPVSIFGGTKCLDVTDGIDADGTGLQLWDCVAGGANQKWVFFANQGTGTGPTIQWARKTRCVNAVERTTSAAIQLLGCGAAGNNTWVYAGL